MDLISERDPLFARYKTAWQAYQAVQASDPAGAMPYKQAITGSANPFLRAAAYELAAARDAWLSHAER
jgi:hypothetical protein